MNLVVTTGHHPRGLIHMKNALDASVAGLPALVGDAQVVTAALTAPNGDIRVNKKVLIPTA